MLHPGAAYFTKRWPSQQFLRLAQEIRERHRLEPVFVAGKEDGAFGRDLSGFEIRRGMPLGELKSLLQGARLFVGNDSGPAHIAAAFGVPCVVIFGSSDSSSWRPWRTTHRVAETAWDCKPCPGDRCYAFDEPRCILSVDLGTVVRAVAEVLTECPPPA